MAKQPELPRLISIEGSTVLIDGVPIPWLIAEEVEVEHIHKDLVLVRVGLYADQVSIKLTPTDRVSVLETFTHGGGR